MGAATARRCADRGRRRCVNVWERWLDLLALATIGGGPVRGRRATRPGGVVPGAGAQSSPPSARAPAPCRAAWHSLAREPSRTAARASRQVPSLARLLSTWHAWPCPLLAGVAAWLLPALGFWLLVGGSTLRRPGATRCSPSRRRRCAAASLFAPGGVVVTGDDLLAMACLRRSRRRAGSRIVPRKPPGDGRVSDARSDCVFLLLHLRRSAAASRRPLRCDRRRLRRPDCRRLASPARA